MSVPKEHPEKEKDKDVSPGVSLSVFRPFFRELDLEVLSVLQSGLLSRSLLDSELHTKVELNPSEFCLRVVSPSKQHYMCYRGAGRGSAGPRRAGFPAGGSASQTGVQADSRPHQEGSIPEGTNHPLSDLQLMSKELYGSPSIQFDLHFCVLQNNNFLICR